MTQDEIFDGVKAERTLQDLEWGGIEHDRQHTSDEWVMYIEHQLRRLEEEVSTYMVAGRFDYADGRFISRMFKVAALAFAAIESNTTKTRG